MADNDVNTPPEWRRERAQLLATIARHEKDAARLAKRFKLLQRTLVDQQVLLDRYQHALLQSGVQPPTSQTKPNDADVDTQPRAETHRDSTADVANASLNTLDNQLSEDACHTAPVAVKAGADTTRALEQHVAHTPQPLRLATQDSEDLAHIGDCTRASSNDAAAAAAAHSPTADTPAFTSAARRRNCSSADTKADTDVDTKMDSDIDTKGDTDAAHIDAAARVTAASTAAGSWITRRTDFHRSATAAATAVQSSDDGDSSDQHHLTLETSASPLPAAVASVPVASVAPAADAVVYSNKKRRATTDRAPTWAEEKRRLQDAGLLRLRRRHPPVDATHPAESARPPMHNNTSSHSQSRGGAAAFEFVEVVRNRSAREALPGRDCIECRKYYDALADALPHETVARAMAKCSRHRARFEVPDTPDDFWRLSFPDSQPSQQSQSP